jgi:hypothetical protein
MAERAGAPDVLRRIAANRDVVDALELGAMPATGGVGPWSPDGWVMRSHPDLTEIVEAIAPHDLRMVYGVATLVDPQGRIYAVARGTGYLWLRGPSRPADDGTLADGVAEPVPGLPGWVVVDAWRVDVGPWVEASATLTRDLVPADA